MSADLVNHVERVVFRFADGRDIKAVAALHADSWRRHYRGAYPDAFLDGDVFADRMVISLASPIRSLTTTPSGAPCWTTCT